MSRFIKLPFWFPLALVFVSWQALMPSDEVWVSTGWDKANHILAFTGLLLLLDQGYPRWSLWPSKCLLMMAYGLLLELLQGFVFDREASLLDLLADALGLMLYVAFKPLLDKTLKYWENA